ncbi:glutamine--fructose-6-phosphate transaminase (isomerizing) [Kiritimatiella glycovorans]|uniref:Glutamine--fructose-6-phosphate aminotransferase [isomerizing] n=1 Tax=Kiritimatiella glycovorans TaxID=1307763 RepID=A0A0G3EGU2_9BACT|nr:glutamine--fructose-6-phosphate transaminase (isomerizing) [Kiritimatiella glycovorans]AKJ64030.1 Glutamine--fructose-6-phosphate aminotransferase (isomerizing) [Kiritimatiella glycovorans]
MCGIIGCTGVDHVTPVLLEGLRRLEYRGYDSAGLAVLSGGRIQTRKTPGRLAGLEEACRARPVDGSPGIAHTRWATHGDPSELNAHPHLSGDGSIAVVHNGIIENYLQLRRELEAEGHVFLSETDTEVLPHLIEDERPRHESFREALRAALQRARGAYALGVVAAEDPQTVYAARQGSPLIIGIGRAKGEYYLASDVPAILNRIDEVIYLDEGQIATLHPEHGIAIETLDGEPVEEDRKKVELRSEDAEKAGFETFMLKEIHEQPRVIRGLLDRHLDAAGRIELADLPWDREFFRTLDRIMIVACGTAYHAGMYGRLLLENLTGLAVETDLASEFRYRNPKISGDTLVIAVSQSGETADTLASIRMAREIGCPVLSICNVPGSSIVRESDGVLFTDAGLEIGVASTKAYTAQQTAFILLALYAARLRDEVEPERSAELVEALRRIPDAIHYVLERQDAIRAIAEKHHDGASSLYLGRKFNYPTALEGALKNKEISYQHAEGYAAGEMKHGPIALINEYLPVICICTQTRDEVYDKVVSNLKEVEARNGRIIALVTEGDENASRLAEDLIAVPPTLDELSPVINVVALQLLAYYAAQARGTDIDKPRNLAKSVTVE